MTLKGLEADFMQENILLMFLSDVKLRNGAIQPTQYKNLQGEETYTTNESAVRYLQQNLQGAEITKIFIFASKAVRENVAGYSEEITHLDYFKRRVKKFLPNIESCITSETIYNYSEDNSGAENLKSVAEMAEKIQSFASKSHGEVILHTDLTGGMRHINMMMLDVIRLLEYSGVKIGKLIYSNFTTKTVEEIKNIYDLFQLISGVEEFINFGSVKVLKNYYRNHSEKISDALQKLLDAMENFAEAIKLCRYGQFKTAIEKLHDAINDFSADENNLNDILMARLVYRIKQEYENLIATRGNDDLKIIRWCVKKGYLQQAMTLYTERVPEYVGEKFISMTEDEEKKLLKSVKNDVRNEYFYLLNNYLLESPEMVSYSVKIQNQIRDVNQKYFFLVRTDAMQKISKGHFDYKTFAERLFDEIKSLTDLSEVEKFFDESKLHSELNTLNELKQNFIDISSPRLDAYRKIIDSLNFNPTEPQGKRIKNFFNNLSRLTMGDFKSIFPTFGVDIKILRLQYLLDNKIFSLRIATPDFFSIMNRYFKLKDERNHSNHARNDIGEFKTAKDLENCILEGLREIEEVGQ